MFVRGQDVSRGALLQDSTRRPFLQRSNVWDGLQLRERGKGGEGFQPSRLVARIVFVVGFVVPSRVRRDLLRPPLNFLFCP